MPAKSHHPSVKFATYGRCTYTTQANRRCRSLLLDPDARFCPRHAYLRSTPDDYHVILSNRAHRFRCAHGINNSLADFVRPRRRRCYLPRVAHPPSLISVASCFALFRPSRKSRHSHVSVPSTHAARSSQPMHQRVSEARSRQRPTLSWMTATGGRMPRLE